MNRGRSSLVYLIIVMAVALLLTACSGESDPPTATPTSTAELAATSTAERTVTSSDSEAGDEQIIATPTLPPTPTPGPVDNLVANLVEDSVIEHVTFLGLSSLDWINLAISILVIVAGYVIAGWLIGVALRWLVERIGIEVADVFLKKVSNQLRWLVVVLLAAFATFRLDFLSEGAIRLFRGLYFSILLWTVFYILWELIGYAIQVYEEDIKSKHGDSKYESMLPLVEKVSRFLLIIAAVIIWLDSFGVNVTGLIAALGIAGLALSLAAQDTLSDAIAGLVILTDQPFRIGDRIEIEEI